MSESPAIQIEGVSKRFDGHVAVDGISLTVQKGRIFGLLGPNGAGKTTTIRMIMNIILPDEGRISILGAPNDAEQSIRIGYLPEERGLYKRMKVLEHLIFLGEIRGLPRSMARAKAQEWMERLDISSWATKKVEDLSKGMQQKIQFIGCIIHDPEIIILDEPFSGLDPVNARVFKDLFAEFRSLGRTLVFSTHVMEQAEKLCDEVAVINRAKLVLDGELGEVKRRYSGNTIVLRGDGEPSSLADLEEVESAQREGDSVRVDLRDDVNRADFLRRATDVFRVESAVPHEVSLDEIFVHVVGQSVAAVEQESGFAKEDE